MAGTWPVQQERRFEQEVLVFRWLTEDESQPLSGLWDKIKGVVDPRPDRTRNVLNPIDISELERLPTVALETRLRVLIDDSARCDATERVEFEFACDRDDAATLGQISAGLIQDVMRLRRAISKLQDAVNDAIANSSILAGRSIGLTFSSLRRNRDNKTRVRGRVQRSGKPRPRHGHRKQAVFATAHSRPAQREAQ